MTVCRIVEDLPYFFGCKTGLLPLAALKLHQISKSVLHNAAIRRDIPFQNNPKNLDPSYEMDLDYWDCDLDFWDDGSRFLGL